MITVASLETLYFGKIMRIECGDKEETTKSHEHKLTHLGVEPKLVRELDKDFGVHALSVEIESVPSLLLIIEKNNTDDSGERGTERRRCLNRKQITHHCHTINCLLLPHRKRWVKENVAMLKHTQTMRRTFVSVHH